ncbi:hypothetical protein ACI3ER_11745 [Bacillus sp. Wb]
MKVYFDLMNGKCIKPRNIIPPAYRATFNWRMKLIKIEACWSKSNFRNYLGTKDGRKFISALDNDAARDFTTHKLLIKTMKRIALRSLFRKNKKYTYDKDRWFYREFWNIKGD